MSYKETKEFWSQQAHKFGDAPEATTNDFFLREIEIDVTSRVINNLTNEHAQIADVGCGNGYSTKRLAKMFQMHTFSGYDYIEDMIGFAKGEGAFSNVSFQVLDLIKDSLEKKFDMIYTNRCLINLPSWEEQKKAIVKLHGALKDGGIFAMVENFIEGQNNFNRLRNQFRLPSIPIREHNLFFTKEQLSKFINDKFNIVEIRNISSQYYLISRIIYSKICQDNGVIPDYRDIHHELGSKLPYCGDFGPISIWVLEKKKNYE